MGGTKGGLHLAVRFGPGVLVAHEYGDWGADRLPIENAAEDFAPIFFRARRDNFALAGPPTIEVLLNFGFGQGTQPQLVGEMFKLATGTDIASIPYKGGAQAITDLLAGQIHMNIGTASTLRPLIRDGRLRALAITSTTRSPDLPEVPTMAESGFPSVTSVSYYGIFGRAGLPTDVIDRLNSEVNESLKTSELKASMTKLGFEPKGGSPRDFAVLLVDEQQRWVPIVKATGFTTE